VYQSQKEFTDNASHEMQTPLAVLQTKLELLMQTQPLTAEQASLISTLADTNSRLAKLNNSLLLLTKIENNQYGDSENINVTEVCNKILSQVSYQAELKDLKITSSFQKPIYVLANKTLVEILISNLLTNAIRYNYRGGSLTITADDDSITIQNTSTASMLDATKIFERFHKEKSDPQSIGLGLAIVKRICALYQFTIQYGYEHQLHTFRIQF
jgi:signal transduction histidine kinase